MKTTFGSIPATGLTQPLCAALTALLSIAIFLALGLAYPGAASAELDRVAGQPLAYDPATGLYWYTDLPQLFGTYPSQADRVAQIVLTGYTNFHLATNQELASLVTAAANGNDIFAFAPTEIPTPLNSQNGPGYYWAGRGGDILQVTSEGMTYRNYLEFYYDPTGTGAFSSSYRGGSGIEDYSNAVQVPDLSVSAWVVGDADPVPEPSSLLLLLAGLSGGALLFRKQRRQ